MLRLFNDGRLSRRKMAKNVAFVYWRDLNNIEPDISKRNIRHKEDSLLDGYVQNFQPMIKNPVIGNDVSYSAWGHLCGFINKSSWWHWVVVAIVVVLPWVLVANGKVC